jgi:FSR family fosmidomycin resistance protein-like MFS transporter
MPLEHAQFCLFAFLAAVAVGTFAGGPVGDRIGRKAVVWISFLGVIPFSLLLPHVGLVWTIVFTIFIGLILSSAFSALVVYAQEIVPGRAGMVAGIMFWHDVWCVGRRCRSRKTGGHRWHRVGL